MQIRSKFFDYYDSVADVTVADNATADGKARNRRVVVLMGR